MTDNPVTDTPAEAHADEAPVSGDEKIFVASQWQLIWWKFRRHRLAVISSFVLAAIYLIGAFCEFLAPYDPNSLDQRNFSAPPQIVRFKGRDGLGPFVYGYKVQIDRASMRRSYIVDETKVYPVRLFHRGAPYKFWGIWKSDLHLFGAEGGYIYLFGTDRLGRDVLSRVLYGGRISTTIGLIGVLFSLVLGLIIGGFSGYFGGVFDTVSQRLIEFLRSIPTIPLWMGLSAALPPGWPPIRVYFGITLILSIIGWTGLARVVRSKFLSLREEDFVLAARLVGAKSGRIIFRHMMPSFMSHIIASVTLAIPRMIIGETSLSFLGIGLRPPAVSWGVLIQEVQNIHAVASAPWLLLPLLFVIVTVLAFNFLGDGLRDAADPYER